MATELMSTSMSHIATARNVARALGQFYQGAPGEQVDRVLGLANAVGVLRFLAGRKLGFAGRPALRLGHNGCTHTWSLVERSDISVLQEIFLNREYALDVPPPTIVLDLGANFGAASVYFAHAWPEARIFAVEPSPEMFRRLMETTAPYPGITCLNYAMGDRDGTADFVVSADHIGSSLSRPDPRGRTITVATRSLRSLMKEQGIEHIDVLKFDIEGAEEAMFRDSAILETVDTLIGEVHKDLIGITEADFLARFDGFEINKRTESGDLFVMTAIKRAQHQDL
jgi:FkbM family methyltransferase